jgi:hypothetical protein
MRFTLPSTTDVTYLYIGNFAEMDTDEGDFDNENPNVVLGVHDSLALIVVTQTDQNDDDLIYDDELASGDTLTYDTGGGGVTVSQDSTAVYNADVLLGDGSTVTMQVIVIQAANGDTFVTEISPGSLDNQAIQSIELLSQDSSNYSGVSEGGNSIDNATIVCYAPGTLITTAQGEVVVEALKPGDLVKTQDHGFQPIRWTNQSDCPLDGTPDDAKPVLLRAGALGPNRPAQDLIVSPNHRILVGGDAQLQNRFATEAFAPAKALTSLPGIRFMRGKKQMTWVHFACDRHEVVSANGCQSESLLLGPMVLAGLSRTKRRTLAKLFLKTPDPKTPLNGPPARDCLTVGATRRHLKTRSHQPVCGHAMAEARAS